MAEQEFENNEEIKEQEVADAEKDEATEESKPEIDEQPGDEVEEAPKEESTENAAEAPVVEEDVKGEETDVTEENVEDKKPEEENIEKVETSEEPSEEVKADVVEEVKEEEIDEPLPQVEDVEAVKRQLAEKEAELEEEKAIKSYENDVREANRQLDEFLANLGNAMAQEFAKYGIDVNTNLDELRKSDPAKAQVAENIIRQAQAVKEQAVRNVNNNLNDRLTDVVFNKAARLFDKFELTQEQSMLAAETFVNILEQTGVKDIGEDLIAKVELAAARAKMLKPKVEKIAEEVKEVVKEVVKAAEEVVEEKAPQKIDDAEKEVEDREEKIDETPAVESVVEAPTLDEFKEGAVTSNQAAGDSVTIDNVLDKMASLPFKDRVRFYADHKELAEEAMAKKSESENKRKRI